MHSRRTPVVIKQIWLAVSVGMAAIGCSGGTPSDAEAKAVWENLNRNALANGDIVLKSFTKTNGRSEGMAGQEYYSYWYAAEVEYPEGLNAKCIGLAEAADLSCMMVNKDDMLRPGASRTQSGQYNFFKTERGWVHSSPYGQP